MSEPSPSPAVSIVVPVKNEAGNVAALVDEIAAALNATAFELIYVNDGSTDGTDAELTALMASRPWLRQIRHVQSCGQSAAVRTGVTHARAPVIATLDGDGQNDPAFIPQMLRTLADGAPGMGLVAGQRVGRKDTGFKKFQSRVANGVRSFVLRDSTRDTGCGLKAFRRDVVLALPYFDGLHRFLPALVRRDGYDHRLRRRHRSFTPRRYVELRPVGSVVGRHPRSRRRVVAHSPQEARAAGVGGKAEC